MVVVAVVGRRRLVSRPGWRWTDADGRPSDGRIEHCHGRRDVFIFTATLQELVQCYDTILVYIHFLPGQKTQCCVSTCFIMYKLQLAIKQRTTLPNIKYSIVKNTLYVYNGYRQLWLDTYLSRRNMYLL